MWFDEDLALAKRFATDSRELGPWAQGSRASRYMTVEQLAGFLAEYQELLDRYGSHPLNAPPDTRPIELRFFAFPAVSEWAETAD